MNEEQRRETRVRLRQARKELSDSAQTQAARALLGLVGEQDFFRAAQRIAFYQQIDGEIDPGPLLDKALAEGKECFLPLIAPDKTEQISFAPYSVGTELTENEWGIKEPPAPEFLESPTELDLVFVPLVGFDKGCFRLGMGKGFYDRTFSFKIFNRQSKPLLVGLAHECQFTEPFPIASWDVRLDLVVTAEKIYRPDTTQGGT